MAEAQELPIIGFTSKARFEDWLEGQGSSSVGLWLKIARKDTGLATVAYHEALDSALCFGWIDGQKGSFDDQYWLQRFTPARPEASGRRSTASALESSSSWGSCGKPV